MLARVFVTGVDELVIGVADSYIRSIITIYTLFRKKTPIDIFFHISMNYLWI